MPPVEAREPVAVYVADYGRHASLILPIGSERSVEWFWGDWNYYALRNRSPLDGLRALFASRHAALGRRDLAAPGGCEAARAATGARRVLGIGVDRRRADALRAELLARYDARRRTAVAHPDGRRFVMEPSGYRLTYNSNHAVASWLRRLGADVRGSAPTAPFVGDARLRCRAP